MQGLALPLNYGGRALEGTHWFGACPRANVGPTAALLPSDAFAMRRGLN